MKTYIKIAKKEEDKSTRNGVLEAGAGAYAGKKLFDKGYIDGRTTLYHGTSESAADKIRQEGLKAKYTAKGSSEAKSITGTLPKDLVDKSKGHTFLTGKKLTAAEYAGQHRAEGGRVLMDKSSVPNMLDNYIGKKKGIVKARVPLYNRETIMNPEARGSFGEWKKKTPGINFIAPTEMQQKSIHNSLKETKVVRGNIARKYIKGDNYKGANLKEYAKFIKKSKGKAALGVAGGLAAAGIVADGARRILGKRKED